MRTFFKKVNTWFLKNPAKAGVSAFLFMLLIALIISFLKYKNTKALRLTKEEQIATVIKQNIEQSLNAAYSAVLTLSISIEENGEVKEFEEISNKLLKANPNLSVTQLVPNGVIKHIYPLHKNEAAYNYNLFDETFDRISAENAIEKNDVYFVGPIDLVQGGKGIIARLPISRKGKFWGFTAVVIRLEKLIETAGIPHFNGEKMHLQIVTPHLISKQPIYLLDSSTKINYDNAQKLDIKRTNWSLYVWHNNYNFAIAETIPYFVSGFLLALLCGFFVQKLLRRPAKLQKRISDQASKLLDSEIKFKSIFEQAGLGIALVNSSTGQIKLANKRMAEMLGKTKTELESLELQDLCVHPHHKKLIHKSKHKFVCDLKTDCEKKQIIAKITNSPLNTLQLKNTYVAIIEDITEKRKAEQRLKDLSKLMGLAIKISKLGFWQWTVKDNTHIWSDRLFEIFGIDSSTILSPELIDEYIHPKDLSLCKKEIGKLVTKGGTTTFEFRLITPKKETKYLLTRVECQEDESGRVTKLQGITMDITQEKKVERDLQSSYQTVLEQNKRLLNFSYIVSHNLRSHTSNIQGILSLLQENLQKPERLEMYGLLREVTNSLDETLNDLNEVINIQNNKNVFIQTLAIKEYIAKAKRILDKEITSSKAKIVENLPEDLKIDFNPAYLESIFLNLISNAVKYRHPERYPIIHITFEEDASHKIIHIKDNGIGIDLKRYRKDIFGMYKKFTDHKDARGLGLFVSKNQMEAMGGSIQVESTLDNGCTFTLYFSKEI